MKKILLFVVIVTFRLDSIQAQFKFDIKNASSTYVTGINDTTSIVGYCVIDGLTCGFYHNGVDTLIIKPSNINGAVAVWLGGINNNELAAGHYSDGVNYKPFMFNPTNGNISYPYSFVAPLNSNYKVNSINDNNVICGDYVNGADRKIWIEGPSLAFGSYQFFTTSGGFTKYPTYGGHGISNDNRVTGWYIDGILRKPFIYNLSNNKFEPIDLGSVRMQAYGINRNNAISVEQIINGKTRGFKLFSTNPVNFEYASRTEVIIAEANAIHPLDINKYGHVCGWYEDAESKVHGFFERRYDIGFRPDPNAFSYENISDNWWPDGQWQHIDYAYDPHRGKGTPFPFYTGGKLPNNLYPSWPLWLETFGANNCYATSPLGNQYLIPSAYFKWEASAGKYEGTCFGLAANSITAWDTLEIVQQRFPDANFSKNMSFVFMDDRVRKACNIMQTAQYANVALDQKKFWRSKNPDEVIGGLKAALADTNGSHPILGIYHGEGEKLFAHALIPFKVVSVQEGGEYREEIYCYDPNKPLNNNTGIIVAPNAFSQSEWKYLTGEPGEISSAAIGSLSLTHVQELFKNNLSQFLTTPGESSSSRSFGDELYSVTGEGSSFRIGENSKYAGPWEGNLLQTLTSANPFVPFTGTAQVPRHYYLPKSGNYSFELKRNSAGSQTHYIFRDGLVQKFQRDQVPAGETDLLESADVTYKYSNNSGNNRIIHLTTAIEDTLTKESLTYIIDSLRVSPNVIITGKPLADGSYFISNSNNTGFYNLNISVLSQERLKSFSHDSIPFGLNASHTIRVNSENTPMEVLILADFENDGIIDDTLFLENQAGIRMLLSKREVFCQAFAGNDTIAVENIGVGLLNWTIIEKPEWITLQSGETGSGESRIIMSYPDHASSARSGLMVIESNQNGNSRDTILIRQGGPVGLSENHGSDGRLFVFPNPASEHLFLVLNDNNKTNHEIRVFDFSGKQVLHGLMPGAKFNLDISGLNQGLYLVEIRSGKEIFRKRFVKG
jgi:hypothetical protein